tara:strand:+ start:1957 stop:2178 length:222 start_codon:yes stop_codon:yes gene_type:complete
MIFEEREKRKRTTLSDMIYFYREQVKRLERIGMGNKTEFGTLVTEVLIECTKRRLYQLSNQKMELFRNGRHND